MKRLLPVVLILAGCAANIVSTDVTPSKPADDPYNEPQPFQIAYNCRNNARLVSEFIANIGSKSPTDIKFFLVCEHAAWCETAAAVMSIR